MPTYDRTRPRSATTDGNINARGRFRGSILVAASDALGIKFGKRRPSVRQPPMPIILPDVIEISAPRADEEVEERNRLREMAAQAIGLGPFMVSPDTQSRDDSTTEEDDEDQQPILDATEVRRLGYARNSDSASSPNINARSPHGSTISVTQQPPPTPGGRFRSGSMLTTNPTYSSNFANIPSFPCTVSSLVSFRQCGGTYLKYYPPSSLRIFALSKSWKQRYLILSSPATLVTRGQGPAVSYLHLFKSSGSEDREVERLEINEDSVVFVAEEEVGGKRQVIKVAGVDVGAMKKEFMHDEGGHSMWLLQITDQAEAQKWITNIKNAILGQRFVITVSCVIAPVTKFSFVQNGSRWSHTRPYARQQRTTGRYGCDAVYPSSRSHYVALEPQADLTYVKWIPLDRCQSQLCGFHLITVYSLPSNRSQVVFYRRRRLCIEESLYWFLTTKITVQGCIHRF